MSRVKPRVFVASSTEGLAVARAIQANLEYDADVTPWNLGVFKPSNYPLEDLLEAVERSDFGVFVFLPEDMTVSRDVAVATVRDNVLFELGLFIGRLGRQRTFIVKPRGDGQRLASDLAGLTPVEFDGDRTDNLRAALGTGCDSIRERLTELGPFQAPSSDIRDRLNEKALLLMRLAGNASYFPAPGDSNFPWSGSIDAATFDAAVAVLRPLQLLRFDFDPRLSRYAYHWTEIGKETLEQFGFRQVQTPTNQDYGHVAGEALSAEERELLTSAAADRDGIVLMTESFDGLEVSANGRTFTEPENARSAAQWKAVVESLVDKGFLQQQSDGLRVTAEGYKVIDSG